MLKAPQLFGFARSLCASSFFVLPTMPWPERESLMYLQQTGSVPASLSGAGAWQGSIRGANAEVSVGRERESKWGRWDRTAAGIEDSGSR